MLRYRQLLNGLWLAWALYWIVSAYGTKQTRRRESLGSRLSHVLPLVAGTVLIAWPHPQPGRWLSRPLLPPGPLRFGGALALVGAGPLNIPPRCRPSSRSQGLGDLHRVERRALQQLVPGHE